jgi:hypothetical protein
VLSEPSDSSFVLRGIKLSRQSVSAQDEAPLPRDLCQLTSHARAIKVEGAGHWVAKEQTGRSNRGITQGPADCPKLSGKRLTLRERQ